MNEAVARVVARWVLGLACVTAGCSADDEVEIRPRLEIIIDDSGVPHIYGATDEDAFYGAGYQMASDRLFHMDQARRKAQGRLAEVHGQAAVEDDELARLFDWPGWGAKHAEAMQQDAPDTAVLVEAWIRGVNDRIAEVEAGETALPHGFGPDQLDYLPDPWTLHDVMTIATMTGFGNDLSFDREAFAAVAFKLFPESVGAVELFKPARPAYTMGPQVAEQHRDEQHRDEQVLPPGFATPTEAPEIDEDHLRAALSKLAKLRRLRGIGSNNWAVAAEHTATGRPLIAGDPHLGFDVPGVFYALHINSKDAGGTIDAAGFSFVGTPGVSVGQTDSVVWTPTTAFADVMDVWTVQMPDPEHVVIAGQTLPVTRRQEVITVRGAEDPVGEGNGVALEVLSVEGYGVILPTDLVPIPLGEEGDRLLMNWIGFRPNSFAGLLDFNRVESVEQFETAVDGFGSNFNFVSADAESISYRVGARVPVRDVAEGRTPWLTLDADDPKTLWTTELLAGDQLPKGRGEGRGFLATANNDPFGFTANGRVDDDPFYYGAFYAPGWRAGRIEQQLQQLIGERSGAIELEDMQRLQLDVHSSLADDLVPLLSEAFDAIGTDPSLDAFAGDADLATLATALQGWDRQMRRDSGEALVLHVYAQYVTQRVLEDDITLLFLQAMDLQPVFILKLASMALRGEYAQGDALLQEGRNAILLAALADTAAFLRDRFGSVDPSGYRLADFKVTSMDGSTGHGIDRGVYPTDGGESTVNVAADHSFFDPGGGVRDQSVSHWGPIFRHVSTFAEDGTPELYFNAPLGNVADPDSPFYDNLHDDWIEGRYRKMPFLRQDVEAAEHRRYTLLDQDGDTD